MAAAAKSDTGRTGAVLALLLYGMILNMLKPTDINLSVKLVDNAHLHSLFILTVPRLTKQTTNQQLKLQQTSDMGNI